MTRTTVAAVLADGLVRVGTSRVFAAPGAARALVDAARARGLALVETRSAGAACVMAAVTAALGDVPGAALARLADGLGSARDGAAHAARERAPLVLLTEPHADARLLAPVVKAGLEAEPASAGHCIAHAGRLAMTEPRGPVHLAVAGAALDAAAVPVATACRLEPPPPDPAALDGAARALAGAARPVLVTGRGCRADDARWLRALAESLPAPVLTTVGGKGTVPDPHPLALGLLARDHAILARADLLVAVGVDAAELAPGAWPDRLPSIAFARAPGAPGAPHVEVVGDLALIVEELAPRLRARRAADWDVAELDRLKRAERARQGATTPGRLVGIARALTPAGTLACADVPAATVWQAVAPRELLLPHGLGTPGYALTAAIAAQLAEPARRVVCLTSAASLEASGELETLTALALPIVVAVLDAARDPTPLGRTHGLATFTAASAEGFRRAFDEAWRAGRPALVHAGPVG